MATHGNRARLMVATKSRHASKKAKRIQALMRVIWANSCSAGKMPGSGVTSRAGMGDNLSEIVV